MITKQSRINSTLWVIIILALSTRVIGLFYPFPFSGDAMGYLTKSLRFGTGDFNPHYFIHPAFSFYVTFLAESLCFAFSYAFGYIHSLEEFAENFFINLRPFLIAGRIPSFLCGLGAIYLLYLFGKKYWNRETGLCAAFFLSLMPLHVLESQSIRIRAIATCIGVACLFFTFLVLTYGKRKHFIFAGLLVGLGVATEYTMVFFVLPFFTVFILQFKNTKKKAEYVDCSFKEGIFWYCLCAFLAFLIFSPFIVFDYPANINEIIHEAKTHQNISTYNRAAEQSGGKSAVLLTSLKHIAYNSLQLFDHKRFTMGMIFAGLSMAGVLLAFYKRGKKDLILLSLWVGYFIIQPIFIYPLPRMSVMAYPVMCLFASNFLIWLYRVIFAEEKKLKKWIPYSIVCIIALPNFVILLKHNIQLLKPDTRLLARDWIESNIPSGSHLLLSYQNRLISYIPINENQESLNKRYMKYKSFIEKYSDYHGNELMELEIKKRIHKDPSYMIDYIYLPDFLNFRNVVDQKIMQPWVLTIEDYKTMGVDYVITFEIETERIPVQERKEEFPSFYEFFQSLEQEKGCKKVKIFRYQNIFIRDILINPEIKIYSLHED